MRSYRALSSLAALITAATLTVAAPALAASSNRATHPSASTWRKAIEVPGVAALNTGGDAQIEQVSCPSSGDCSAVGYYTDSSGNTQAFVVGEVDGTWGTAIEAPGSATLDAGGFATLSSVSCASAGNCSAGGSYTPGPGLIGALAISEVDGTWGMAVGVPTPVFTDGVGGSIASVSCASAGNCSAGGLYGSVNATQAFVVSQVNGTWGKAIEVPGVAALNQGESAEVVAVSCASAGNCGAGGDYLDGGDDPYVFVTSQVNGKWRTAELAPRDGELGYSFFDSVSCASPGNCSAGGQFSDPVGIKPFVISEVDGTWRDAKIVPGATSLTHYGYGTVSSVACASAGNCSAVGSYRGTKNTSQGGFMASQSGGTWGKVSRLASVGNAANGLDSVSCPSAGNCVAGGGGNTRDGYEVFVASQSGGTWQEAIVLPGIVALNQGKNSGVSSVSCAPAGTCSIVGTYTDSAGHTQVFVDSQTS
jgi:hypothetical protein